MKDGKCGQGFVVSWRFPLPVCPHTTSLPLPSCLSYGGNMYIYRGIRMFQWSLKGGYCCSLRGGWFGCVGVGPSKLYWRCTGSLRNFCRSCHKSPVWRESKFTVFRAPFSRQFGYKLPSQHLLKDSTLSRAANEEEQQRKEWPCSVQASWRLHSKLPLLPMCLSTKTRAVFTLRAVSAEGGGSGFHWGSQNRIFFLAHNVVWRRSLQ